ncbi:hypothetical protein BI023_gp50 [Mycobacterium phage Sneeze]|uniref:Uncharacterized protein n=1 Tax=Mycobacterium phage Rabbs TaxID=2530143 RepID=A0A481VSI3_9CAUD|nr:hypothetical protein BI023_gp50 [Mycobacterium phage Sneeze]YP_010051396.1 hypothetical protein KDW71_gp51 [Mycobacterium phage Rabbs]ANU79757.1 hypothetical protein SEA_SNEEZE_50 [Mycobacterium phage Sneeze]QBI96802.1 hypothetical protein SEA_RABBS_51 [Mycobacterium phage Rabbs]
MTELHEMGPGPDIRAGAFIGAWDRIEAAQKLKADAKGHVVDPLPELYWATLAEADVLARLATADEDPGRDAGAVLVERDRLDREHRARFKDALNGARRHPHRAAGDELVAEHQEQESGR